MVCFIVEGQNDEAFIRNILSALKIDNNFKFVGLKGDGRVKRYIKELKDNDLSNNTYFAIVDADNSFSDTKKDLEECIGDKKIDFFIFPNNKDDGELEDLILSSIGNEDDIIKCFDSYKKCIKKDISNKQKLYAYTDLQHNQRPEEYITKFNTKDNFEELKQKIIPLFLKNKK